MAAAWREHPRVVVVQVVGLVVLVVVCIFIGMALKGDPKPQTPVAVQDRISALERRVKDQRGATRDLARIRKTQATQVRRTRTLRRKLRSAAARERRLRAALRRARP